jgi:hypothetical protein
MFSCNPHCKIVGAKQTNLSMQKLLFPMRSNKLGKIQQWKGKLVLES